MPKYQVLWHDAEDDLRGEPFEIEAQGLREAYSLAEERIRGLSAKLRERFCPSDIAYLVDRNGNRHNPDDFLEV